MNSKILAASFIEYFCKADIEGIASLLSTDFHLKGPLFEFESKRAYLDSLKGNLEVDPQAEIISVIGHKNEAAAFFKYKGNIIGQLFLCNEDRINETLLVFDARKIT